MEALCDIAQHRATFGSVIDPAGVRAYIWYYAASGQVHTVSNLLSIVMSKSGPSVGRSPVFFCDTGTNGRGRLMERYWVGRRRSSPRVRTDNSDPEFPSDLYAEPPPRMDEDDEPASSGDVQQDELERALEAQYLADARPDSGPPSHEREQWRNVRREAAARRFNPA